MTQIRNLKKRALYLYPIIAVLALPSAGWAQQVAAQQPVLNDQGLLSEVVVTANRRAQTVNTIPMSIAAVTQEELDHRGLNGLAQLQDIVPGLNVTNAVAGVANFSIRGIAATTGAATTGVYMDDVSLTKRNNSGVNQNNGAPMPVLYDTERVEVLKGPQGTLYGGGSEGGTVRIITRGASLTSMSGSVRLVGSKVSGGNLGSEFAGAIGGPIVQDKLGFRFSATAQHKGGSIDVVDPYNNGALVHENADRSDTKAAHLNLLWQATDKAQISYTGYVSKFKSEGGPGTATRTMTPGQTFTTPQVCNSKVRPATVVGGWVPTTVACPANGLSTPTVYVRKAATYGPFDYLNGHNSITPTDGKLNPASTDTTINSISLQYEFDGFEVKSITSYLTDHTQGNTPDGSAAAPGQSTTLYATSVKGFPLYGAYPGYNGRFISSNERNALQEELRLTSRGQGPLSYTGGLFISSAKTHINYNIVGDYNGAAQSLYGISQATRFGMPDVSDGVLSRLQATLKDKEVAAYGEAAYKITPRLKVTAGVRYSDLQFDFTQRLYGVVPGRGINDPYASVVGNQKDKPITPKVGVEYKLAERGMVYANASRGFRGGGVNTQVNATLCATGLTSLGLSISDIPKAYNSDAVWSYESGGKFRLFDNKLQLNAAAYYIDWTDMQVAVTLAGCGQNFTINGGHTTSKGLDLQAQFRPTQDLSFSVAAAYNRSGYVDPVYAPGASVTKTIVYNKGDTLNVPEFSGTATAQYEHELLGHPSFVRLDFNFQGRQNQGPSYGSAAYNPYTHYIRSVQSLNLRAGVGYSGWDLNVYVNNLLDEHRVSNTAGNGIAQCNAVTGGPSCSVFGVYNPVVQVNYQTARTIGAQASYRF